MPLAAPKKVSESQHDQGGNVKKDKKRDPGDNPEVSEIAAKKPSKK